ncbi:hypothetical protein GCK32_018350 [Trichostrongylus colubriformis]|uniref:Proteasome activator Blm10 middle HEAT repeats region domain-containing protein n=1 Tax=Trichostrongylus colubriformis TaxID=6319 RepID=A0AAN8FUH6_TRICO
MPTQLFEELETPFMQFQMSAPSRKDDENGGAIYASIKRKWPYVIGISVSSKHFTRDGESVQGGAYQKTQKKSPFTTVLHLQVPKSYYLTDDDIAKFTDAVLPSLLYAMYTKDGAVSKTPAKLVMMLCALCPGRVFPKVFEHIYPAIFAVDEPHRLTQTLNCLFELVFLISQDNNSDLPRTPMEKDWILEMEEVCRIISKIIIIQCVYD